MTQPLDVAYVDIVANTKPLQREVKQLDKPLRKIEKLFDDVLKEIDKTLSETADDVDKSFKGMADAADRSADDIDSSMSGAAAGIDREFKSTSKKVKREFKDIGDAAGDAGDRIDKGFAKPVTGVFGKIGETAVSLGSALIGLGASAPTPAGLVAIAGTLALIAAAAGPILAVGAALSQLIGLLALIPAAATVALAAIAPLVIAFNGFGDAISAIISKDPKKIAEALKELSPAARSVALELRTLLPQFEKLGDRVQESFFKPLRGALTQLVTTLLPTLSRGMSTVAASFGKLISGLVKVVTLPENVKFINELFATTGRIIDRLGPNLAKLFSGFLAAAAAALPTFEKLAGVIGDALGNFGDFLAKSAESGDLQTFLDNALKTLDELVDLFGAVGGLLGTIFGTGADEGRSFIETLTDLVKRMDEFFKSAEGQDALNDLIETVKTVGAILGGIINTFLFVIDVISDFDDILSGTVEGVSEFIGKLIELAASIRDKVLQTISELPEKVKNFFKQAFDKALEAVGIGIGLILFAIQELPNQIANFLSTLPERIKTAISTVKTVVVETLTDAFEAGKKLASDAVDKIVGFVTNLPERIKKLKDNLLEAGKTLIKSFMNGLRVAGDFISNVAGDIFRSIKGLLNRVIDKINDGISKVDSVLPGDLGRIPRLAQGALVRARPGGIIANIGEGREDEVVAPLSKLDSMLGGGNINFGPGSINVVFEGATPTAGEAVAIGQGIGRGIISTVAKRNVNSQLRTV